jgi:hypothetical protein
VGVGVAVSTGIVVGIALGVGAGVPDLVAGLGHTVRLRLRDEVGGQPLFFIVYRVAAIATSETCR